MNIYMYMNLIIIKGRCRVMFMANGKLEMQVEDFFNLRKEQIKTVQGKTDK